MSNEGAPRAGVGFDRWVRQQKLMLGWCDYLDGKGFPERYENWPEHEQLTYESGRRIAALASNSVCGLRRSNRVNTKQHAKVVLWSDWRIDLGEIAKEAAL